MRPEIKIGDRVRFRTDGEIGAMMKVYREFAPDLYGDEPYIVTAKLDNGLLRINDRFKSHPNELDICKAEPKQEPKFADIKVGDWVEHLNGSQLEVIGITNGQHARFKCSNGNSYKFDGTCICDNDAITRILKASEVVLDFGSGIKGTIKPQNYDGGYGICVSNTNGKSIANFMTSSLSEPMKSTVLALLERQKKEDEEIKNNGCILMEMLEKILDSYGGKDWSIPLPVRDTEGTLPDEYKTYTAEELIKEIKINGYPARYLCKSLATMTLLRYEYDQKEGKE